MLFQAFFDYLNVIYCSVLSLIITFGYNDVSLLKHADISVTWYYLKSTTTTNYTFSSYVLLDFFFFQTIAGYYCHNILSGSINYAKQPFHYRIVAEDRK